MAVAFLLGRIILGVFYLMNAMNHFTKTEMMTGYAAYKGVPSPKLGVLASGVMMALGGLSFITGILPTLGVAIVVIFLLPASFMVHNFWAVEDETAKMGDMINFMKNMALIGSSLMFLAIDQPWPLSLGF